MTEKQITVAIPTMRRWKPFLEKSLPIYLQCPQVSYVLVCDETGEDIAAIRSSPFGSHPKLRLLQNEKRLGAYLNKRKCIEHAPSDWVAVLDSDNIFSDEYFEIIEEEIQKKNYDPKYIFVPGENIRVFTKTGAQENRTAHFSGMTITRKNWNQVLQMPAWNFLLNDGNYVVHRSVLKFLNPKYTLEQVYASDAILAAKQFVENGCFYTIVPGLRYIHTVHDDSEWLKTDRESTRVLNTTDWRIYAEN
jgi:glycosyltransferase involved in cell wall biosynthesis